MGCWGRMAKHTKVRSAVVNASRGGRGHPAAKACTLVSKGLFPLYLYHQPGSLLALISGTATGSFETGHVICSVHASSFTPPANPPEAAACSHAQATRFIAKTRHPVSRDVALLVGVLKEKKNGVTLTYSLYVSLKSEMHLMIMGDKSHV
ncbi:hypothetical protein LZ30DRAFT_455367 [Colletotrichum cereale]|nr:hypothetical protein LZ30DRAFT_455367 [Colletotrichum cereale]